MYRLPVKYTDQLRLIDEPGNAAITKQRISAQPEIPLSYYWDRPRDFSGSTADLINLGLTRMKRHANEEQSFSHVPDAHVTLV